MRPTLIIDADDTLWENNIYYEQCIADFAELMAAHGFEPEAAERMADAVERERVPIVGYAPEEFARSLVIAYQRLCERYGRPVEDVVSDGVWEIGQRVLEYPIALLDGVEETLALLSGHCRLFLLTKGDREAQESKVARSGLGHFFEKVHIVPEKDAQVLRELTVAYGLQPERTWMVGNSPRSDINPALEAGIGAIYIPHPNTWNLEIEEVVKPEGATVLEGFVELAGLFPESEQRSIMSEYTIRPYDPADNAGLAVMLNESDDQWPGTLTGGVPATEEIMRDWVEKETCLMRLVVEAKIESKPAGKIVGYGTLWPDPSQQDTCYVDFLNVHPDHQKRSLARRMLTQMVDWATEKGYGRMTIGTWPGNLKSVPLYKKVGFFWMPDTDVHMENYIPTLRQLGIAREFFDRHDWYATFRRELKQVEDEQRHPATGDMKVYVVRWEEDGEYLEAVVDRQAQALTGLETSEFAAYAVVDESEPAQGIAYPVRWRVANKRAEAVNVSVLASGETGIDLSHRASFTLSAGEERILETTFTCAVDAPRLDPDKEKPAPKIKTTLVIGGDVVELGTGLRYRSAVTFATEPEFPSLLPGRSQTVHLQLRNRARRPLSGTVQIAPQKGLVTDWQRHGFELEADGYAGLPLTVTPDRDGAVPLEVTATFVDGGQHVTTAPQRMPLLTTPLGGVSAGMFDDRIVIENDFFQVVCRAKGGDCRVLSKVQQQRDARIGEEVGPPFDPWELHGKRYDLALERGEGWAKATLTAKSDRLPGVAVTREITVTGSALIQVCYRLVNSGAVPYKVQVRPTVRFAGKETGQIALPHQERLVIERASEFFVADGDMPKKPELLAEQWTAHTCDGHVIGAIWSEDVAEHEFRWQSLFLYFSERALEPQGAADVGPFYVYSGPGDWQAVRLAWQRTVGRARQQFEAPPDSDRPHAFGLSPTPLITLTGQVEAALTANTTREYEIQGRIIVEPPPGWTVDRPEFLVEGVSCKKALEEGLCLSATSNRVGAVGGRLRLEGTLFDEVRPFSVIRLGDENGSVQVEESEQADQPVWTIANGRCTWTIAPDFHGGLIAWREAGSEVNHLMTAFPDDGELGWLKPWFGGVRPMIMPADDGHHSWPGKLHEETFTATGVEIADARGILWRGAQVMASLKREGFEGLRAEIAYLTVGSSNVLKIIYRLVNEMSAYRRTMQGLLTFCQPDGQHQETVLYGEGFQRKRAPQESWTEVGAWGAVVNPASGRAVVIVGASERKRVELSDWGVDGGHPFFYNHPVLKPHGTHEMVAYLALAESLEEAEQYASLAEGT
jgi:putative hydrolase of the HAD superfamily